MKLNHFIKSSLSRQFIALMGSFLGIFLIGSIVLLLTLRIIIQSYTVQNEALEKKERLAQQMNTTFNLAFFDARGYLAFDNVELKKNALGRENQIRDLQEQFSKIAESSEDQLFLSNSYQFTDYYFSETLPKVFELHEKNDKSGVVQIGNKQATSRVNHFQDTLQSYVHKLDKDLEYNFQELLKMQSYTQMVFVAFILLILLSLLRITRIMINRIGLPLSQFVAAANELSDGREASIEIDSKREDEIGLLSTAFQKMVGKVQEKEQDLLSHNEELQAQQDELQSQQRELEETLEILKENESKLNSRNKLINKISNSLNKQEVLDSIVESTCEIIDADRGMISMLSDEAYAAYGISKHGIDQFRTHWDNGLNQRIFNKKKPIALKREMEPVEKGYHIGKYYSYDLYVPIISSNNDVFALMVYSRYSEPFLEEDMEEYEALAKNIGIALDKISLFEKSEAERKLNQDILNTVHEGIQFINENRSIVQVNEQLYDLFKLDKKEISLVGLPWEKWTNLMKKFVSDDEALLKFLEEATDSSRSKSLNDLSYIYRNKENDQVIKIYCEDLYHDDKKFGTVIVHRDITKEYEVDQMKSEFVSTVSHELRTPLASILGFTELMLNRELRIDKQQKYLSTIFNEAKRLTALINDFLDVQKMESGKQTYEKKHIEILPILEKVIDIQKINAPRHTILLHSSLKEDRSILGDRAKVEQVLTNIINNAIKYSPDGGKIDVTISNRDNHIAIAVKDQGLGIPSESINKLFTKFYRVDNSDRRKIGGTGLGLAIVLEIMKAHEGDVLVESEYGVGSTFTMVFPVVKSKVNAVIEIDNQQSDGNKYRIMVVEDDSSLAQLIMQELAESGFHTFLYKSGVAALEALRSEIPDAIVLDIMLEDGIDGWSVMSEIKKSNTLRNIPIIVSTALDEKEKGISLGATDYLVKPYKPSQLSKAIMQTLLNIGKVGQILVPEEHESNQ